MGNNLRFVDFVQFSTPYLRIFILLRLVLIFFDHQIRSDLFTSFGTPRLCQDHSAMSIEQRDFI